MLWQIEAAGRNQEDVLLSPCRIINTRQRVGEDGGAELLGTTMCQNPGLLLHFKNSEQISALHMQMQFNGYCRFSTLRSIQGSCA